MYKDCILKTESLPMTIQPNAILPGTANHPIGVRKYRRLRRQSFEANREIGASGSKASREIGAPGFTLVEVVLALGIVSFALVSLLGLLAMGTTGLNHSIDMSVETQIIQSIDAEVVNLDYSKLGSYGSTYPRFYDADGGILSEGQSTYAVPGNVHYAVNLSGSSPTMMPGQGAGGYGVYSTGTGNSVQLIFTMSNQLDRSGQTLSGWANATSPGQVTGTNNTLGKSYSIWVINNGR